MPIMSIPSHAVGPFTIVGLPSAAGGGGGGGSPPVPDTDGWTFRTRFAAPVNEQRFSAVSTDSNNNYYAVGYDRTRYHLYLGKYNSTGYNVWRQKLGGSGNLISSANIFTDTVIDSNDDMVSVGYGKIVDERMLFVKYDSSGNIIWNLQGIDGGVTNHYPTAITADTSGNTYVAVTTRAQSTSGNEIPVVIKLNSSGSKVWAVKLDAPQAVGNSVSRHGIGLKLDSNGGLVLSGMIQGSGTSGNGTRSGLIIKLNSTNGAIIWSKIYDEPGNANGFHEDQFYNCGIDHNDDIITGGSTQYQMGSTHYGILMKVSGTNGNIMWQRRILEPNYIKRVAVTSTGKIYASTAPVAAGGAAANVLYVYQNNGTLDQEWTLTSGAGSGYYIEDIHIDKNDNAILAGYWDTNYGTASWHNFITKLPATIQRSSQAPSGDWYFNPHTINGGDTAGGLSDADQFTTFTSNTFNMSLISQSLSNQTWGEYALTGPQIIYGV